MVDVSKPDDKARIAADQSEADAKAKADANAKAAAEGKKKYEAAQAEANKLAAAAAEAHEKADKKDKTPEQTAAEEADQKADDARAKAAALHPDANPPEDAPAGNVSAGRVKLNVPGRPAYAPGIPTDDEAQTVTLFHISEDGASRVHTRVHPDMVGDYMRAGWARV